MGFLDRLASKVRTTVAPAAAGLERAAGSVGAAVTQTVARLDAAASSLDLPRSAPRSVDTALRSGLEKLRGFADYLLPSFGTKQAAVTDTRGRFHTPVRGADEIRKSGALEEFKKLEGVQVPKSELNRNIEHDAILVRQGLAKMSPEQIAGLKAKAYEHPEVKGGLAAAKASGHYGSAKHKQYGALVEQLTGGVVSAEEAMAMNPTGGLPGPGAKEIPLAGKIDSIARHAMRHDATGFLTTRFGVGPGYGSKTTPFGFASKNPLAGQYLGVFREAVQGSKLPSYGHVGAPVR